MSDPQTTPTAARTPDGDAARDADTQPGGSTAAVAAGAPRPTESAPTENTTTGCGCSSSDDAATPTTTDGSCDPHSTDGTDGTDATIDGDTDGDTNGATEGDSDDNDSADTSDPVSALTAELDERTADLQRLTAEYANFRRRTDRDRTAVIATAKTAAVTEFLPVVDDLELAEQHGDLTGPLKAIHDKLVAAFTKLGVEKFAAAGDTFDPEIHEAVQDLSSSDTKVVGTVLRPGYRLGDKLMRTAMVIIADAE